MTTTVGTTPTAQLSYGYNADGDRTSQSDAVSGQRTTYGWDQADRLITASVGTTTTASYAYNGDGLRQSKTANGSTTQETWDVASSALPQLLQDGTTSYVYGPLGPIESISGTTPIYVYQDQLGSTRALVDASGTTVGTYTYDAYGTVISHTGTTTPLGFAGQDTDAETGLQYLQARYYEPGSGQFLSADPLVDITRQPYMYAWGDPVNIIDPSGLWSPVLSPAVINPVTSYHLLQGVTQTPAVKAKVALAKAAALNSESVASLFIYAPYWVSYKVNTPWHSSPNIGRTAILSIQHVSLSADESFDRFQQWSGYPGANANDEGQDITILPSFIYPIMDTNGNWHEEKVSFGPKSSDLDRFLHLPVTPGPGRHANGCEDYAP